LKIWIDALTPKQLIFFHFVSHVLRKSGHDVYITTRDYHDSNYIVNRLGMKVQVIGKHGGKKPEDKLIASLQRSLELVPFVKDLSPNLSISFSSPEAARVSTGMGLVHVAVNDSPHSSWVAKLTIPLSSLLFSPWVIPNKAWRQYGIDSRKIISYRALDPAAWLKRRELWPKQTEFERSSAGAVIIRAAETHASYMGKQRLSLVNLAILLAERFRDKKLILLPRYKEQEEELQSLDAPNVMICKEPFFGPNLLQSASLLIGGGGTMNAEASLLGVPVISFYEGPATYVENYLVKTGFVRKVRNEKECIREAADLLENSTRERLVKRAELELASMEDPSEVIASKINELQTG
jgi:predicted glycosyltransferase